MAETINAVLIPRKIDKRLTGELFGEVTFISSAVISIPGIDPTTDDEWLASVTAPSILFDCIKSKAPNPNPINRIRSRPMFPCIRDF
jgi:hypothetical protein